ncbi:glycine cleavage system protein H [Chryseobacterium viscerum]|uniref:Glycine cleavage system protein H n=1 Tax=Chryseobacterium viscerum TaxID=1037377 RepID=A0A316WI84_9FLAO|nr:glycine cleavage system protein H [Chryseobacterium viscerum]PWN58160.1 glycine cleavage system protein H [Chryseobacterium viscerum]
MLTPKNLYYTKNHLWLRKIGLYDFCIGITDFAQKEIGEIDLVEFNVEENIITETVSWGAVYGINKTFSLISPCDCKIIEVNTMLNKKPSHINTDPYSYWFLSVSTEICTSEFLTGEEYIKLTQ